VGHKVHFQEAGPAVVPVGERPHGYLITQERAGLRRGHTVTLQLATGVPKEPVCRRRAHPLQKDCYLWIHLQFPVTVQAL